METTDTWSIWTLYDADGAFLGRTQASSEQYAIDKWLRLYGEQAARAQVEAV